MRVGLAPVVAIAAASLALPPACLAGQARVEPADPGAAPRLLYAAAAGERNQLSGTGQPSAGADFLAGAVELSDSAGIEPGAGCMRPDPADATRVLCPAPAGELPFFGRIELSLGDGDDTASFTGVLDGLLVDGGAGNDALSASLPSGLARFVGGPGDDVLSGGPESDIFSEGAAISGSDTITGGSITPGQFPDEDVVTYFGRSRGVRASLDGRRNDGAPGERDLIGADVELLTGGRGKDRLTGNERANALAGGPGADRLRGLGGNDYLLAGDRRARDSLLGGRGIDDLIGGPGSDRLDGGAGADRIEGGAGPDRVRARDGATDEAACGAGRDLILIDSLDYFENTCERVRRRGSAVAVAGRIGEIDEQGPNNTVGLVYAVATVLCPPDGPPRCGGRLRLRSGGRLLGRDRFNVRRGQETQFAYELPAGVAIGDPAVVELRTRDASDRGRVIRRAGLIATDCAYVPLSCLGVLVE